MHLSDLPDATAERRWNKRHTTATVHVTLPNGHEVKLGGQRAARCQYAVIYKDRDGQWAVLGLRTNPEYISGWSLGDQACIPITDAA